MRRPDGIAACEVGDGPGHFEDAVERPSRQAELLEGGVEEFAAGRVEDADAP